MNSFKRINRLYESKDDYGNKMNVRGFGDCYVWYVLDMLRDNRLEYDSDVVDDSSKLIFLYTNLLNITNIGEVYNEIIAENWKTSSYYNAKIMHEKVLKEIQEQIDRMNKKEYTAVYPFHECRANMIIYNVTKNLLIITECYGSTTLNVSLKDSVLKIIDNANSVFYGSKTLPIIVDLMKLFLKQVKTKNINKGTSKLVKKIYNLTKDNYVKELGEDDEYEMGIDNLDCYFAYDALENNFVISLYLDSYINTPYYNPNLYVNCTMTIKEDETCILFISNFHYDESSLVREFIVIENDNTEIMNNIRKRLIKTNILDDGLEYILQREKIKDKIKIFPIPMGY
ncbi:MAG: hypothetical protein QXF12_07115 [Candidatus Aenigmatarchaeota archaeon]